MATVPSKLDHDERVIKPIESYAAACGDHVRTGARQSIPSSNIDNCAALSEIVPATRRGF